MQPLLYCFDLAWKNGPRPAEHTDIALDFHVAPVQVCQALKVCHDLFLALFGLGLNDFAPGFDLRYLFAASGALRQDVGQLKFTGLQSALMLIDSLLDLDDIGGAHSLAILLHTLNLRIVRFNYFLACL